MYNTGRGKTCKLVIKLTDKPTMSNWVLLALFPPFLSPFFPVQSFHVLSTHTDSSQNGAEASPASHILHPTTWRPPAGAAVVEGTGLPVERVDVRLCCGGRPPGGAAMGEEARLPVEPAHVQQCCKGRSHTGTAVVEGAGLPVERRCVQQCCGGRSPACAAMVEGAGLPVGRRYVQICVRDRFFCHMVCSLILFS